MLDLLDNSCPIDAGNPVNWTHPTMQPGVRPVAWYLALPGLMGGAKWHDLMSSPDLRVGNHGTLTNGPTWKNGTRPGTLGGELDCSAAINTSVRTGKKFFTSGPFSMGGWFKRSSFSRTASLISQGSSVDGTYIGLRTTSQQIVEVYIDGNNAINGVTTLLPNVWYHYFVTYDPNLNPKTVVYLNAAQEGAQNNSADYTGDNVTVGNSPQSNPSISANGPIDSIRLYSRALPSPEVASLYDLERRGLPGVLNRVPRMAYSVPADIPVPVVTGTGGVMVWA